MYKHTRTSFLFYYSRLHCWALSQQQSCFGLSVADRTCVSCFVYFVFLFTSVWIVDVSRCWRWRWEQPTNTSRLRCVDASVCEYAFVCCHSGVVECWIYIKKKCVYSVCRFPFAHTTLAQYDLCSLPSRIQCFSSRFILVLAPSPIIVLIEFFLYYWSVDLVWLDGIPEVITRNTKINFCD